MDGKIAKPVIFADTLKFLRKNAQKKPISSRYVVAALPEEKVYNQIITVPLAAKDKIKDLVYWQSEKILSFPLDNVYLDYHIITQQDNKLKVLITAAPKDIIDALIEALNRAKITILALDTQSGALARLCANAPHELVLIVDNEQGVTRLVVAKNNIARLSTSISLNPTTEQLKTKIKDMIIYYTSRKETNKKISKIVMTGNVDPAVTQEISEFVSLPVMLTSIKEKVRLPDSSEPQNQYIINLGLYTHLGNGVNLLPESFKTKLQNQIIKDEVHKQLDYLIIGTALMLIGAIVLAVRLNNNNQELMSELTNLKLSQQNSPSDLEPKVLSLNQKLNQIKTIETSSNQSELLSQLKGIIGSSGQITRVNTQGKTVTLEGIAPDRQAFANYQVQLEEMKNIASLEIPLKNYELASNFPFEIIIKLK